VNGDLLQTKLYLPALRSPSLVPRPHLVKKLDAGLDGRLTLVSAPAGFGKTMLVSEWARGCGQPVAWFSIDKNDNDPLQFWSYFIAALRTIPILMESAVGEAAQTALESTQSPSIESLLSILINEIADVPDPFVLVLDDYHEIEVSSIHEQLAFLLQHQPPQMHLIIASRSDPPLNLSRLRGRGQLAELRTEDLRFRPNETAVFLNEVMGLHLSADDIAALEARTEGWIVGLQMAALSMRGRDDEHVADFVTSFTGSHRYVLDYLSDEVLSRQPEQIQTFLLQTALLGRLSGPLCDAVTKQGNGQEVLQRLDTANLFLVRLDDERRWYRYHHLFADLLRSRLERSQPDLAPILHLRASAWYEANGLLSEAVGHAFAAGDINHVATMLEGNALSLIGAKHLKTSLGWLKALPSEVVYERPWLCIAYAWTLAYTGFFTESLVCLEKLESEEHAPEQTETPRHIAGHANAIRFYVASFFPFVVERAEAYGVNALAQLPQNDVQTRSLVAVLLSRLQRMNYEYRAARETLSQALTLARAADQGYAVVELLCQLARVEIQQGFLRQAAATCQEALSLAGKQKGYGGRRPPVVSFAHASLAHVLREWNQLENAQHHAEEAIALSRQWEHIDSVVDGYVALLWIQLSRKDGPQALDTIRKIKGLDSNIQERYSLWLEGWEARARLALGDVDYAILWAKERELEFFDGIVGLNSVTNLMLARIKIMEFNRGLIPTLENTIAHLASMLNQFEIVESKKKVVAVLILQAMAQRALGDDDQALAALTRALSLAEPEGYVRSFIDEGAPMVDLLRQAASRGVTVEYVGKLLSEWEKEPEESIIEQTPSRHLIEPLTERELEILRLLTVGLSNQEIAEQLFLAVGTVKKYTSNIYGKLGVHSRTQAVARARELGLV
jgi:LuxR family maltose regulon positive regulatory protein